MDEKEVLIKFETKEQAEAFVAWLSNSGEQEYFAMKDYLEEDEDESTIVDRFDYDYENNIINGVSC